MKYLNALLWFMAGSLFATLLINSQVISKHQGEVVTEAERAIYNLHDHLLDFVFFFGGASLVCLFLILALRTKAKYE